MRPSPAGAPRRTYRRIEPFSIFTITKSSCPTRVTAFCGMYTLLTCPIGTIKRPNIPGYSPVLFLRLTLTRNEREPGSADGTISSTMAANCSSNASIRTSSWRCCSTCRSSRYDTASSARSMSRSRSSGCSTPSENRVSPGMMPRASRLLQFSYAAQRSSTICSFNSWT